MNKKALEIAYEVKNTPGNEHCFVAGNICTTNIAAPFDKSNSDLIEEMF